MRRPDMLVLIAVWEFLTALGAFIGISAIGIFAFPEVCRLWGPALVGGIYGLSMALLMLLCYTSIAVAGGIGLLNGKKWGRSLSIAHAAVSLLWIPFGTIIGIIVIIYLIKPEVREYFESAQE